jgi:hypothetical protein
VDTLVVGLLGESLAFERRRYKVLDDVDDLEGLCSPYKSSKIKLKQERLYL